MVAKPKPAKQLTAYMSRAAAPQYQSKDDFIDAVLTFLPALEAAGLEAIELHRALQEAELTETDPGRAQHYEEVFQKIGALRRISGEATTALRQMVKAHQELEQANDRLKEQVPGLKEMS